jgi:hypothetical protein
MKYKVYWKGASGDRVDTGPVSLDNAIALADDFTHRGMLLFITDDTGKRLTLKAAERLKSSLNAKGS